MKRYDITFFNGEFETKRMFYAEDFLQALDKAQTEGYNVEKIVKVESM